MSISPIKVVNLEPEEGTDYYYKYVLLDDKTNLPIDLTGYSALIEIRSAVGSPYKLLSLGTTPLSGVTLGDATGLITIHLTPSQTDQEVQPVGWDNGVYDLVLTDTFGVKTKVLKGFVVIGRTSTHLP